MSNRTIYNHFTDKAELFQTVIQESTQRAAGHLMLLVSADNLLDRNELRNQESPKAMVTTGVRAFLRGYAKA